MTVSILNRGVARWLVAPCALALVGLAAPTASAAPAASAARVSGSASLRPTSIAPILTPPDPVPPGRATFGIQPSSATAPDGRSALTYSGTRGASVSDHVVILNYSPQPVTLNVYAADAFNTPQGGFDVQPAAAHPVDIGSWVTVSATSVTIPGRGHVIVGFHVVVPRNATPGDHAGGIVAALSTVQTDSNGDKVTVDQRVGTRIYLRLAGQLRATLSVDSMSATYHPSGGVLADGKVIVHYTVRNTGNVRLGGHETLVVTTPWGHAVSAVPVDVTELLPGGSISLATEIDRATPSLYLDVHLRVVSMRVAGDIDPPLVSLNRTETVWAVSWPLVVAMLLLLAALGWLAAWLVRRRGNPAAGATATVERTSPQPVAVA